MKLEFGVEHGLAIGEEISFDENSITFRCAKDDYLSRIFIPRITDPSW